MGRVTRTIRWSAPVLLGGAVCWAFAVIGYGRWTEDLCLHDLDGRPSHGAYTVDAEIVPPSYRCSLTGNGVADVIVEHRFVAVLGSAVAIGVPLATAIALAAVLWWQVRPFGRSRDRGRSVR